jgi:ribonuclease HI
VTRYKGQRSPGRTRPYNPPADPLPPGSLLAYTDGACEPNPGPAAIGGVVLDADTGKVLATISEPIGLATSNRAEFRAVIAVLTTAARIRPGAALEIRADSNLAVQMCSGRWQGKNPLLQRLARDAQQAERHLGPVRYVWIPRERNGHADALAGAGLRRHVTSGRPS